MWHAITRSHSGLQFVAIFHCLILPLFYGCNENSKQGTSWSVSGRAGLNDEYCFLACFQYPEGGPACPSPMLIWKQDAWPPVSLRWQNHRWSLVWPDGHTVEYAKPSVLLYSGPDQPLREIAPHWDTHKNQSPENIRKHLETFLEERIKRGFPCDSPASLDNRPKGVVPPGQE